MAFYEDLLIFAFEMYNAYWDSSAIALPSRIFLSTKYTYSYLPLENSFHDSNFEKQAQHKDYYKAKKVEIYVN